MDIRYEICYREGHLQNLNFLVIISIPDVSIRGLHDVLWHIYSGAAISYIMYMSIISCSLVSGRFISVLVLII